MSDSTPLPRLSVVICTRNRGDSVVAALDSIFACQATGFEVLVIDQSTNAETETAVQRFLPEARFRYIHANERGTGRARNMGLHEARGDYVLYTDDDCTVAPDWIEGIAACFEAHPRVAVVFSNVEPAPHDAGAGFIPAYRRSDEKLVKSMWDKCLARGIGASMAVRRNAALEIGGFDIHLGPGTPFSDCEDGDMAVRALLKGWQIFETHKTHVIHDGFRTWEQGKELTKRNWIGIGAAYSKPLRCGHWRFAIVVAFEAFGIALLKPLSRLFKLKRPQGMRSFFYFWQGFFMGWKAPLDCKTIRYQIE